MFAKQMFVFSVRTERDLFVKSSANFDVNVSGISQTCFPPLSTAAFTLREIELNLDVRVE